MRNLALVAALIEAWIVHWPLRLLHTLDKPTSNPSFYTIYDNTIVPQNLHLVHLYN